MRIRILSINKHDAYYDERHDFIGEVGRAENIEISGHHLYSFDFLYLGVWHKFMYVNFEEVK